MDAEEFRRCGREMIDYVADYLENIRDRRPLPTVQPGYLRELIPEHAPDEPDEWEQVFGDIERVIMPGIAHWQHPNFNAYFCAQNSYPATLADILSDSIGCIGFTWASSPACTELEVVMMDWLGKMLDLPSQFLASSGGPGGGVIQGSACESTLIALLAARTREINKYKQTHPDAEDGVIMSKFVAYRSDQSHSSVERAGLIACIKMRQLESDDDAALQGDTLQRAIDEDRAKGLTPIFLCATLGTTASCAFDNILDLGKICEKRGLWMHIDAAYAGSAFICPEYRPLLNGVEYADSFVFIPTSGYRSTLTVRPCGKLYIRCILGVKNSHCLTSAFNVDLLVLRHEHQGKQPDYRHWHIPLSRRFRSLKVWFVLRLIGKKGLQQQIRKDIQLAKEFEALVRGNDRYEIVGKVTMGLVCFRVKTNNEFNERLLKAINDDGRIHMVPSKIRDTYFLRYAVGQTRTKSSDIHFAWKVIQELFDKLGTSSLKMG